MKKGTLSSRGSVPFSHPYSLGAILLAAGASSRMGQPKLLLPWKQGSILGHVWDLLASVLPDHRIVVIAPHSPLQAELDALAVPADGRVLNPDPSRGMFSSIETAFTSPSWPSSISHFLLALGDQPLLPKEDLFRLLETSRRQPDRIVQPVYQKKSGHPLILPRNIALALLQTRPRCLKEGLASFSNKIHLVESSGRAVLQDIDTPEDYRRFSGPSPAIQRL